MRSWLKSIFVVLLATIAAGAVAGFGMALYMGAGVADALKWAVAGAVAALVLLVVAQVWQG